MCSAVLKPSSDGLFFAAVFFFCNRIQSCQLLQQSTGIRAACITYFVMRPFAFLPTLHNTRFNQNLHVVGKSRLPQVQLFQQNTGTFFSAAQ